ncbi:MAG TPA: adenosine deaminase family protein [Candidatus Sabulitectum sp.]|nr:adenosine deaminase family protein [Candidatus Sabulitectum sp.]HPF32013.1 adenosine deaminase family protein [Candidatus Sabulitectum sp.]HPJ29139.1 adenosine deaminase family protein [Candidatus Sabulitectum sp.]HPR21595.1 adenosine deaminase family protein [Candidatus Sabulitectum sp.]
MEITRELIERMPKTDLHLHLDGSIRIPTLIELARSEKVELPSTTVEGLRETVFKDSYESLDDYLKGFGYTCAVMRTRENIERIAYELAVDNQKEGVRYIEVRFAPQLHAGGSMNLLQTIQAVDGGLARAKREFNHRPSVMQGEEPPFEYGIITCAMRYFNKHFSDYFRDIISVHSFSTEQKIFGLASLELVGAGIKARKELEIPVVGIDIAGSEKGNPPVHHREAYMLAQRNFIKKTVHAGEAYGPESIYQAITELGADRIGHGTSLFNPDAISDPEILDRERYVDDLVQFIADRRITLEVCLTSNMQTDPSLERLEDHPFRHMVDNRLSCSICTDNRTVSHTTVTDEVFKAVSAFDLSMRELKNLIVYGFKRSFFPGTYREKRDYVRKCMEYFERVTGDRA